MEITEALRLLLDVYNGFPETVFGCTLLLTLIDLRFADAPYFSMQFKSGDNEGHSMRRSSLMFLDARKSLVNLGARAGTLSSMKTHFILKAPGEKVLSQNVNRSFLIPLHSFWHLKWPGQFFSNNCSPEHKSTSTLLAPKS